MTAEAHDRSTSGSFVKRNFPVIIAIIGNTLVMIAKLIGGVLANSTALIAEGIHSLADTGNQALLLIGAKKSEKAPDARFNFGYGQQRFLFGFLSANGIFYVGATVNILFGAYALITKKVPEFDTTDVGILVFSYIVEGFSLRVALKELKREGLTIFQALRSKNPTLQAIIFEDGGAMVGLGLFTLSMILTMIFHSYVIDGICSILIGIILGILAFKLGQINGRYLTEEAMPEDTRQRVLDAILETGLVHEVVWMKSAIINVDEYRVVTEVSLCDDAFERFHAKRSANGEPVTLGDMPRLVGDILDTIKRNIRNEVESIVDLTVEPSGGQNGDMETVTAAASA